MNPPIQLEGQPLSDLQEYNQFLNENSKKLDRLTNAVFIVGGALIITLVVGAIVAWMFIDYYNLIDYIAFKMRGA